MFITEIYKKTEKSSHNSHYIINRCHAYATLKLSVSFDFNKFVSLCEEVNKNSICNIYLKDISGDIY